MTYVPLALAGLLLAGTAFAQTPPQADPAPPPPGPHGDRPPPPPPRGAFVHVDRPGLRFDLHCAESDTTRECGAIALQLIDKLNGGAPVK